MVFVLLHDALQMFIGLAFSDVDVESYRRQ
jgi:hypothetical protein